VQANRQSAVIVDVRFACDSEHAMDQVPIPAKCQFRPYAVQQTGAQNRTAYSITLSARNAISSALPVLRLRTSLNLGETVIPDRRLRSVFEAVAHVAIASSDCQQCAT